MVMLRHSHIAIRKALPSLASAVNTEISSGEDDLGLFSYFDIDVFHRDGGHQRVRFASHDGDRMVHLLAEHIEKVSDLAAALLAVGVGRSDKLSISTDHKDMPVRSERDIRNHMDRIADTVEINEKGADAVQTRTNRRKTTGPIPLPRISVS